MTMLLSFPSSLVLVDHILIDVNQCNFRFCSSIEGLAKFGWAKKVWEVDPPSSENVEDFNKIIIEN